MRKPKAIIVYYILQIIIIIIICILCLMVYYYQEGKWELWQSEFNWTIKEALQNHTY